LEEERNSIVKFIEEIDKDKRQTFLESYDKVDKDIREVFHKMTGGNAWLEIQNEDDIFASGLSFLVQFPNKQKRESTSISGGEKTLAAITFLLALQTLKPSPFYLLDEVDAHLDALNTERLSKILEERSRGSQIIMVSLKDSTVQKANLIYGVFPKNGVSQVVSHKISNVPQVAN
ncbi:MAG: chromosome segregation protein SMC, partial [Thaumarchaeota archaeon]